MIPKAALNPAKENAVAKPKKKTEPWVKFEKDPKGTACAACTSAPGIG